MNFQNLPAQLIILLFGWSFTLYLDRRSKHRTEAIKRKDYIVSKIEDIADWLDDEVNKDHFQPARTESTLAGLITQIELKMVQFNSHVKKDLLEPSDLSKLRDINLEPIEAENAEGGTADESEENNKPDLSHIYYQMRDLSSDLIENIESRCNLYFFPKERPAEKIESTLLHLGSFAFTFFVSIALLCLYDLIHASTTFTHPIYSLFVDHPPATQTP
ncbi:hypothetical protein M2D63_015305 [Pseudomonas sp. BJa5]|uniref:hypothetical protein n=1 Tax=Pseudomonas sp. BJa5 TaxID=2936270 RepID=UPI002559C838|nr:hypothetical protein [Pseudomonas sp. BGr12]MDL2422485.1 hypothetical protein [Pseudomonas sp. BGr12]